MSNNEKIQNIKFTDKLQLAYRVCLVVDQLHRNVFSCEFYANTTDVFVAEDSLGSNGGARP